MASNLAIPTHITDVEEDLRRAMLTDDLAALDRLLSDDLIGVDQTGHVFDKALDLELHRSGALHISAIDVSDRRVMSAGDVWLVTVQAQLEGTYEGVSFSELFRYSRAWCKFGDQWKVVFAHFSPVT